MKKHKMRAERSEELKNKTIKSTVELDMGKEGRRGYVSVLSKHTAAANTIQLHVSLLLDNLHFPKKPINMKNIPVQRIYLHTIKHDSSTKKPKAKDVKCNIY